ncbi:helix-turn-helix transcriptional regulator [Weissella hellenica]|nr:helix-turn-helix transcriptional regulator [Weissella hellenica]
MDLGTKIKVQRERKHWSQQELADQIHISRQSISKWEQNRALPSITNIIMMSNLFNMSLDELMKDDATLAAQMDAKMKVSKTLRGFLISLLSAFILFIIIKLLNVDIYNISEYFSDTALIIAIIIMFKIDWYQLDKIVSKKVGLLIIFTLILYFVPVINNFIMSFIAGFQDGINNIK